MASGAATWLFEIDGIAPRSIRHLPLHSNCTGVHRLEVEKDKENDPDSWIVSGKGVHSIRRKWDEVAMEDDFDLSQISATQRGGLDVFQ